MNIPHADTIKGTPCWQFDTLTDVELNGLWGFVDMLPEYVQTYLEEAVHGRKGSVMKVTPGLSNEIDTLEDGIRKVKGWGFRD